MSRFDLEQEIMECWGITEDLKVLVWKLLDSEEKPSEDDIANALIGLETLYDIKFQKLFKTFEDNIRNEKNKDATGYSRTGC